METIRKNKEEHIEDLKAQVQAQLVEKTELEELLPSEILDLEAGNASCSVWSSYIFIHFHPDSTKSKPEQLSWVAQAKLFLTQLLDLEWDSKLCVSETTGGLSWASEKVYKDRKLYIHVWTPKPPKCNLTKEETTEVKEVKSIKYRVECPPEFVTGPDPRD